MMCSKHNMEKHKHELSRQVFENRNKNKNKKNLDWLRYGGTTLGMGGTHERLGKSNTEAWNPHPVAFRALSRDEAAPP